MPPFRRKKSGKSFPVKVCTLDAELEFNLEVSVLKLSVKWYILHKMINTTYYKNIYSGGQLGEIYLI